MYQNVISIGQHEEENRIRGFILEKGMPGLTAPKVNKCIIACKQEESWQLEKKINNFISYLDRRKIFSQSVTHGNDFYGRCFYSSQQHAT